MSEAAYTCIEQLDLASRQLDERNPSYARFALILTDNVVELIIHKACARELAHDDMWVKLGKPKFTAKQRSDALGQRFDRKVKLCKSIGKLTSEQSDAIQICHKYRNELYHSGLKYSDIIWDISWYYHDIAIELLATVFPERSWYSNLEPTKSVIKHAGKDGKKILSKMTDIAQSLRQAKPHRDRTLSEALSESALHRVNETFKSIVFLVSNDQQKRSEVYTIQDLQFYDYIRSEDPLIKEIWSKIKTTKHIAAAIHFIREIWKPKYVSSPLPMFNDQAKRIEEKSKELDALREFERFKKEFAYFSGLVEEAALALDQYIELQIDEALEK